MAVMITDSGGVLGVQGYSQLLISTLTDCDHRNAAVQAHDVINNLGQECVGTSNESTLALQTSVLLSKENGLLFFLRKSLSIEEFKDCREEALRLLITFVEKIGPKVISYACDIKETCLSVFLKERAAKCRVAVLDLLIKLLQNLKNSLVIEEFKVQDVFNRFYGELAQKSKICDTVLEKIYEVLGVLGEVQPSEMFHNSEKLFRIYLNELKCQMTSATREPKLPVIAGCLKGLRALLINFTKSMEEDPKTSKEIFEYAFKAISPQDDFKRYAVPLAGLRLFALHAGQFDACLMNNYRALYETMSKWCGHQNSELKKAGNAAMESFLKQVALLVAEDPKLHKTKLDYFVQQFYKVIRTQDSSTKELSIAIKGYGLFAAPCRAVSPANVDIMYTELIQRCKQMYLTETDTEEDNLYQLPSFIHSIASVIFHMDTIPEIYTPVLERLLVVQIDNYPSYSQKMQPICCKAIVKVFLALAGKGPILWSFISTVVHQGLIRVCSKPLLLAKEGSGDNAKEEQAMTQEVRTGKWKVPSYKDYLDLFSTLLDCDKMKESLLMTEVSLDIKSPLQSLNHLLYDELIKSVLKIVQKLDLTVQKQSAGGLEADDETSDTILIPTSDPAANLQPAKPKDFTAFINLVEFCRELLPGKHVEFFQPWLYVFAHELILQSTRLPLVSGFYKLLSVALKIGKKGRYFEGVSPMSCKKTPEEPEKFACFALFSKFGKEVSLRTKQYKDELLASCLTFILSLPHDIVAIDVKAYVPALQTAFKLGLSCTPLADIGLDALEEWSSRIPKRAIRPYYKDILPCLDGYLKTTSTDEIQNNWQVTKVSRSASEKQMFKAVLIRLLKKTKHLSVKEDSSLAAVRCRVVRILGSLGGQINRNLVTAASAEEMMKKFVSWDTEKRLSFAVPFTDMKPVIYLDTFLPCITELALSASERKTKIAACELLHSVVVYMLGKGSQIPEGQEKIPPMYELNKHVFPVLLHLACDVDQVTRQLYEPLVMQLIHWFTSNKKFESQDTVAMLEAILNGIIDPIDSTLRDFCGQCIQEFLKWSIKQTSPKQQEKSPANAKSLFKRLYSLALHPNPFKRLGAALAFNNIYREFREESSLVEQFVFEALVVYLESLALAHNDEKSLGTVQQCCNAIDHLKRIINHKAPALNKATKVRMPRGFPPDKQVCLSDIVMWLLLQCGRPQTECRHKSMELFFTFVPLLPGNKAPSMWLDDVLKKEGVSFLINKFENAGSSASQLSGILAHPTLRELQESFTLRAVIQWMDMLLAALDCYNTFIGLRLVKPNTVIGIKVKSGFLKAINFFLSELAANDITAAEQCFSTPAKSMLFSPREMEEYNYNKCTILVRIMEFVSMILESCQQDLGKVLEKDLLNDHFLELTVLTVCDPSSIGFNVADVEVMKNLPEVCVKLLKALMMSPYKEALENKTRNKITPKRVEELCEVNLYDSESRHERIQISATLSACKQLHKAGLLNSALCSQTPKLGSKLLSVVYKGIAPGDERKSLPSLDVNSKRLADGLLQLSFSLGGQCEELVSRLLNTVMLSVPLSGTSQRNLISFSHGQYFYSLFSETVNAELLKNLDTAVFRLMPSVTENPQMVSIILNGMLDQSFRDRAVRKQQGTHLVNSLLKNWKMMNSWWAESSSSESKMAVLTLLSKILQIDSSVSSDVNHEAFPLVFNTYTSLLTDLVLPLNLKSHALIILPFFTNLPDDALTSLKNALDHLVAFNFPMKSDEFSKGTLKYNNYADCLKKLLDALELSQSSLLLKILTEILCRDSKHSMEDIFQTCFKRVIQRGSCDKKVGLLTSLYKMFQDDSLLSNITRQAIVDRSLLTLLIHCSSDALKEFFCKVVVDVMENLQSRVTRLIESAFDTQLTKKIGCFKMLEIMYSRLPKDDVYSKESTINRAFLGKSSTEGNELSKTLLKLCHDTYTENMAGETLLLEKRRQYHCASYNCSSALISCIFTEIKFYQGFLFSEKPEKNIFIFENLIDMQRTYSFPVEVEVPIERKRRYIAIRKEARDAGSGDFDEPQYLSSQSYMADSSLSEEMSQFDFSTGVQSFSYSSQGSSAVVSRRRRKQEGVDSVIQDDVMELEMDELNQHECMTTLTALINHMHKNQIITLVEEGTTPQELPSWMKFLHSKLGNPATALNIRLFIAKLIVNTEEVFRPYARHWIGPLLQLIASSNNGGEGIHFMVVEVVVTVLSWTSVATPKGSVRDEILANRLLEFLMKNAFHEKRAVFRHNLEIIKTVIECWKDCLSIPYSLIYEKFSGKDVNTKDNSVGIQLMGIVLANNLPPHDPKSGIDSERYFQALANNLSLVRFKEVYGAAAEVMGLALQYLVEKEKITEGPPFDYTVKVLKQLQTSKEDRFIMCLSKVVKNFPPLADRFLNIVFFMLPKMHGVLKTHCLEVILCRAEAIPDLYIQLKSKEFIRLINHRDDERQKICLDIVYKMMTKLHPAELRELLAAVSCFISHPSVVCRERMYDILMWIHDNYRDPESEEDDESKAVFQLAKELLLQGLTDKNPALQLYVRNFWSHETRLPTDTLSRMLAVLRSLYSSKIESQFLSLATNLVLEMTSKSPDYNRQLFEYPLSECKFQDYIIDSDWRYRSTVLTPMFAETQASQSGSRYRSQEGSLSNQGSAGRQLRATQQKLEFTPTQNMGGRSSFNWLTGSSLDTFMEYSLPSASEALSSSLLVYSKPSEKRAHAKPLGPDFGKKRLALPGDEVDSGPKALAASQRADILRLRRRFLKDQKKVSLFFARKGAEEQKQEKKEKAELQMKQAAQVTLYRNYRYGDLPDIQIEYSSLIAPLQALAQQDPVLAKQLFSSLFAGILKELEKCKKPAEYGKIIAELQSDFNLLLSSTTSFYPPFITCIQDMSCQHPKLLDISSASVSTSSLASLQQPMGILVLEQGLIHSTHDEEPPTKKARGRVELPPDTAKWIELAKLYRSLGDYDVLRGIFSGKIGTKSITHRALLAEAKGDYAEAARLYDEALNNNDWPDDQPIEEEKDFWEIAALECYDHLTEWKSLVLCATINIDDKQPANLENIWNDPFYQDTYLPYVMRSKVKLLQLGEEDQSLLTFIDNAMKVEEKKSLIETHYSQELSLLYILQDDFDRAKYYTENCMQVFVQNYSSIDTLMYKSRLTKLQHIQALTEVQDFLDFITKPYCLNSQDSVKRLLRIWTDRYPDAKMDPINVWDDIITNRCFFLDKIQERLAKVQGDDSMEVDEAASPGSEMEVDGSAAEMDIDSMIKSCKFTMRLKMAESARKQSNFPVATKLLKDLYKQAKCRDDWMIKWVHSYSRFSHHRCQNQNSPEQILTVMKTISLLEESKQDYLNQNSWAFRDHNILLGTTYHIIGNAVNKDRTSLESIERSKVLKLLESSGATKDSAEQVAAGMYRRALYYLQLAVRKVEEVVQSRTVEYMDTAGAVEAYMSLAEFCDKQLREKEENPEAIDFREAETFPTLVAENMLKALKLNSKEARLRFPRLLQIVERYPAETLDLMANEVSSIPCWQFIGWISQMMALLDKPVAVAVQHILEEIAETYPQAIDYAFMISSENFSFENSACGHKNKEFVNRLKSKLDKGGVVTDFIRALEQLTNPGMIFKDWLDDMKNELEKSQRDKMCIKKLCDDMFSNLANLQTPGLGAFRTKFIKMYGKQFEEKFGKGGAKVLTMKAKDFTEIALSLFDKMREAQSEPGNLKEYSPWMSEFKPEFLKIELEIPGQYDGKSKPMPEYHTKITGFDERVKVMSSIRRPKRLIIRGNDEKDHPFLVKGGEDLRQDQRIEQLFDIMNIILSQDAACSQRHLQLKTYQVIPMTTRIGLIEWLENTCTLKEFLLNNMAEDERNRKPQAMYSDWLTKMAGKNIGVGRYGQMYMKASRTETIRSFRSVESLVPADLLRRAFMKMSTTPEAFLALRSHFASSHALMCVSHWLLGIGDRHLSNFMINMETGGMVGIDFGHAFGSATQFLPVPELMPFRLTRQFLNLMLPMKESGLIYSVMVHGLRAYRTQPDLLLNTMDVFVKEPSLDWKNFEIKQLKKGGTWTADVNTSEINWYPMQKVNCARQKLEGANPTLITCNELRLGHEKMPAYKSLIEVTKGEQSHNIRAQEPIEKLSVETQVACLIDQATDPNILGRVWEGWEPWM